MGCGIVGIDGSTNCVFHAPLLISSIVQLIIGYRSGRGSFKFGVAVVGEFNQRHYDLGFP